MEEEELARGGDGRIVSLGTVVRKEHRRHRAFQAELDALHRVQHESVIPLVGVCYDTLSLYLPRFDLDLCGALLNGEVDVDWAVVAASLLGALSACHRHDLLHRDIKPENVLVMLRDRPSYVLCDFGRSVTLPPDQDQVQHAFCGTAAYGAPEALRGRYGKEADLFSAGIVLFAAATQELPFEDEELQGEEEIPPPLEGLDEKKAELLRGLLRWEPCRRPSAAAALGLLTE